MAEKRLRNILLNTLITALISIWIIGVSVHFLHHVRQDHRAVLIRTIDYSCPSFNDFNLFLKNDPSITLDQTKKYVKYFKIINKFFPQKHADVICGIFYAAAGDFPNAKEILLAANNQDPDFFWAHYNLGLIYFREGNYTDAAKAMQEALNQSPDVAILKVFSSEAYMQILRKHLSPETRAFLMNNIQRARTRARLVLAAAASLSQTNENLPPPLKLQELKNIPFNFF